MNLGTAIKEVCKKRGMDQAELAQKVDMTPESISKIVNSRTRPSEANLKKICDALGVTEAQLYMLAIEESDVAEDKREDYRAIFFDLKNVMLELVTSDDDADEPNK